MNSRPRPWMAAIVLVAVSASACGDSGPSDSDLRACVEGKRKAERFLADVSGGTSRAPTDSELLRACEEDFRTNEILDED